MQSQLAEKHSKRPSEFADKRSELRLEMDVPVMFRTDRMSGFEEGLLANLSKQGLLMFTIEPIVAGTEIHILVDGEYEEPLLIRAQVIRSHPGDVVGYISACHVYWHGKPTTSIDLSTGALGNFVNTDIQFHGSEHRVEERRQRPHERTTNLEPGKRNRRSGRGRRHEETMGWI